MTGTPAPHPAAPGRVAGRDPWAHTRGCDRSPETTPRPPQVIGWDHRDSHEGRGQDAGPHPAAHGTDAGRHARDPHQDGQDTGSPHRGRRRRLRTGPRGLGDPDPRPLPAEPLPVSLGPATHHPAAPLRALPDSSARHSSLGKCALRIHNTWANSGQVSTAPGGRRPRPTRAGSRPPGPIGSFRRMSLSPRYAPPRSHWALLQALRLHWRVTRSPPCGPDWTWLRDSAIPHRDRPACCPSRSDWAVVPAPPLWSQIGQISQAPPPAS